MASTAAHRLSRRPDPTRSGPPSPGLCPASFLGEAGLADARLTHADDHVRAASLRLFQTTEQHAQLKIPTDQPRGHPCLLRQ